MHCLDAMQSEFNITIIFQAMSRLIVKNLPSKITDDKLREKFSQYGVVTDVKLVFTKSGKFRRFAFVGYRANEEAENARNNLHKSLLNNQRMIVENCRDFGVQEKAKKLQKENENDEAENENNKKLSSRNSDDENIHPKSEISDLEFMKSKTTLSDDEDQLDNVTAENDEPFVRHHIRMRGCPFNLKEKQVREFFYPLLITRISIQKSEHGNRTGTVFVSFTNKEDVEQSLKHDGDYLSGRYIELFRVKDKQSPVSLRPSDKPWMKKVVEDHDNCEIEDISETGRLFVRNLSYTCTESDLEKHFEKFGPLSEVNIPLDNLTHKSVGFGFVTFMMPEHGLKAFNELDGSAFQGRMLHILPAKAKTEQSESNNPDAKSSFKKNKASVEKKSSQSSHNWNSLFVGTNSVADALSEKYNEDKNVILSSTDKHSAAVRVALGETQIIKETRDFLIDNGVSLDAFSQPNAERSKTVIIAKNLSVGATSSELREMFEKHARLGRLLLSPSGVTAIVECLEPSEARNAFMKLAYRKFHHKPLYLEWAPMETFVEPKPQENKNKVEEVMKDVEADNEQDGASSLTLFVKNLNFETTDEAFRGHFEKCGPLLSCAISKKKTHKRNILLSMGYGFVTFKNKSDGQKALKTLQNLCLDGHKLELKLSERKKPVNVGQDRKRQEDKKQVSSKILIRNIPFQANVSEIRSLFKSFGELKSVRLPKKLSADLGQSGHHRGFAFVDFVTKQDAKSAFETLCHSTHLYGRRLVLEWADSENDTVEGLRRKTSEHYHGDAKKHKSVNLIEEELTTTPAEVE
ncbi:putative RNA-binding protein 19 [Clavelina lepadiformis]|uniref:putative RNA-binding protein 19 n=1 Tax=Clavelina lepadiformis TaxID=159417 RepID=UPI00404150F8